MKQQKYSKAFESWFAQKIHASCSEGCEENIKRLCWSAWCAGRSNLKPNSSADRPAAPAGTGPADCSAWISVQDRYPDDARDVLTRGRYGVHKACFEWGTEDDPCWWSDEVRKADFKESVTHWLELPNS